MFIPNGFKSSDAARRFLYDEEGRLKEFRAGSKSEDGGVGEANSLFSTEAELFGSIAPFLKVNKAKDAPRRNYIIQPGGACIMFEDEQPERTFSGPSDKESFGHNSMDGSKLGEPNGRAITVGQRGTSTGG